MLFFELTIPFITRFAIIAENMSQAIDSFTTYLQSIKYPNILSSGYYDVIVVAVDVHDLYRGYGIDDGLANVANSILINQEIPMYWDGYRLNLTGGGTLPVTQVQNKRRRSE